MPRDPRADLTGNAFLSRDTWYVRVSLGAGARKAFALPWAKPEQDAEANARAALMARLARDVRATKDASVIGLLVALLGEAANASTAEALQDVERTVERLLSERKQSTRFVATRQHMMTIRLRAFAAECGGLDALIECLAIAFPAIGEADGS